MDDSMDMVAATRACASCKKNKRRCDKSLPSCNLCLRSNRICDYSDNTQSSHRDEIADLRSRLQRLEQLIASSPNPPPYPASDGEACNTDDQHPYIENLSVLASYLDSEVWSSCNIPNHSNPVYAPPEILSLVGGFIEIENLKLRYFSSIHTWMPIVSKLRLNRLTQNTTGPLKADTALLLLCLRLSFSYGKSASTSKFYHTIKEFSNELELKGIISLRTVQAGLLLCVYEIGHGIFPAAFLNISCCARQGIVLGLHHKSAPQSMGPPRSWVDWEERQRVWWLIIILDRYIAIGVDHRPLCTEDPTKDTLLPASDSAWDSGEMMSPERVLLSSGSTNTVSSFARMAQASNLLGLVIRHCNDTSMDLEYVLNNFELLSRSLKSLLEMTGNDKDAMSSEMSTATALCFSALLKLANHHSCDMQIENSQMMAPEIAPRVRQCMQQSIEITKELCNQIVSFVRNIQGLAACNLENVSPLILQCIYTCASNMSWMAVETGNSHYTESKNVCEDMLYTLSNRWEVAGVYMEMQRMSDITLHESV